jgi:hypothetical protein
MLSLENRYNYYKWSATSIEKEVCSLVAARHPIFWKAESENDVMIMSVSVGRLMTALRDVVAKYLTLMHTC